MDARERLSYYKRKILDGAELTPEEDADYQAIVRERGEASAPPMPQGGQVAVDTEAAINEQVNTDK